MKLTLRAIALVLLLLAAAATASADTLTLLNGGNNTMGGVYVGPYNFAGSNGLSGSLHLICDDFQSVVTQGEYWDVKTSTFPSLMNAEFTPPKYPNSTIQYQEIAWLVEQMSANLANSQTVGEIQWAIWDVFKPGVSNNDPYGTISTFDQCQINGNGCSNPNNWLQMAINNASSGNYSNLIVYTPIPNTQGPNPPNATLPQEYFGVTRAPEPGTLMLIGTGLLGLAIFRRRFSN